MNEEVEVEANIEAALRAAIAESDATEVTALLDPLPFSEALRELLTLSPPERDIVLQIVPAALAAELIEEAPDEMAAELVERLTPERRRDFR